MGQRTFLTALLTLLAATLGLIACAGEVPITSRPLPTLTPSPTPGQVNRWPTEPPAAEYEALGWLSHHRTELAGDLAQAIIQATPFPAESYTAQIIRDAEIKVLSSRSLESTNPLDRIYTIRGQVSVTFTVDHPQHGGAYHASLPVLISMNASLPADQKITDYSVSNDDISLTRRYSR